MLCFLPQKLKEVAFPRAEELKEELLKRYAKDYAKYKEQEVSDRGLELPRSPSASQGLEAPWLPGYLGMSNLGGPNFLQAHPLLSLWVTLVRGVPGSSPCASQASLSWGYLLGLFSLSQHHIQVLWSRNSVWARFWDCVGKVDTSDTSAVSFALDECDFRDRIEGSQAGIVIPWKRECKAVVFLPLVQLALDLCPAS